MQVAVGCNIVVLAMCVAHIHPIQPPSLLKRKKEKENPASLDGHFHWAAWLCVRQPQSKPRRGHARERERERRGYRCRTGFICATCPPALPRAEQIIVVVVLAATPRRGEAEAPLVSQEPSLALPCPARLPRRVSMTIHACRSPAWSPSVW